MTELNWPPNAPSPCPSNSFGMGNEELTDQDRILHLKLWDIWESEHPDDPTGEVYLKQYNEKAKGEPTPTPTVIEQPQPSAAAQRATEFVKHKLHGRPVTVLIGEWKEVRYRLPKAIYEALCAKSVSEGITLTSIVTRALQRELTQGKE